MANGSFTMYAETTSQDSMLIPDVLASSDVPMGPHLLSVVSHDYSFESVCSVPALSFTFHSKALSTAASRRRQ